MRTQVLTLQYSTCTFHYHLPVNVSSHPKPLALELSLVFESSPVIVYAPHHQVSVITDDGERRQL